jgi:hypothetical protein
MSELPRCSFHVKAPTADGKFTYAALTLNSSRGDSYLVTAYPPLVGDLISLYDPYAKLGGVFRVVDRMWMHSSFGSIDWPYGQDRPSTGPLLDIIVVAAEGMYVDEANAEELRGMTADV